MSIRPYLSHHDSDHLFGGIDPEVGAEGSAPAVVPDRAGLRTLTNILHHAVAQPKAITGTGQPDRKVANVIGGHQLDGLPSEQPHSVQLAAVQHHLMKLEVVRRRGNQPSRAREEHVRLLYPAALFGRGFDELDLVTVRRVGLIKRGKSAGLRLRHIEIGIAHAKRLEYSLLEEFVEGLA